MSLAPAMLLEDLAWARRLAYRLTHDAHEADDLVQDAFIVTQTHPPRAGEPLRPWLYRVMQNLSRMRFRAAQRRTRRELSALTHEDAHVTEQLEAHSMLASALAALREPYRTTLFARYHDDLSAAEIAARAGIPAATVRSRIREGLRLLTAALDEKHGGRAAWQAAFLPFARAGSADRSARSGSGTARTGARNMTTMGKLFLAASAVTAAVVGAAQLPHASAPTVTSGAPLAIASASAPVPTATAPALSAKKRAGAATTAEHDDYVFGIGLEGLPDSVMFSAAAIAALHDCIFGIDGTPEPRAKFSLRLVPATGGGATVAKVTPTGAPLYSELEHPAVQRCLDESLRGQHIDFELAQPADYGMVISLAPIKMAAGATRVMNDDDLDGSPSRGSAHAPVTLVEYSDFECSFCARAVPMMNELAAKYGDELRIVFRENPLPFHEHAQLAAEAALAANDQGQFWPMHDALFNAKVPLTRATILQLAAQLSLDVPRLQQALDAHTFAAAVARDQAAAVARELNATPAVTVNGRVIMGVRPLTEYTKVIDDELAKR